MRSITNAIELINALDGDKSTGMCRCPAHGDKKPSLHVSDGRKRVVLKCHAGCPQENVLRELRGQGIRLGHGKPFTAKPRMESEFEERELIHRAWGVLRRANYAKLGPPIDYLKSRGINLVPHRQLLLMPPATAKVESKWETRMTVKVPFEFQDYPAMVAPVIGDKGLQAVHLRWLSRDGKSKLEDGDRNYGSIKGGYVALGDQDADRPLIVAEGIETALSASQLAGVPAIATLGATNMPSVNPRECSEIIIAADNDEAGREAAQKLAQRLCLEGRKVRIAAPPQSDNDWNDTLRNSADADRDYGDLEDSILNAELFEGETTIRSIGMGQFIQLNFPPRQHLLKPWLATSSLNMIDSLPGVGKTILGLSIGYAVASGKPLLDWTVERRGKVLFVDGEMDGRSLQERLTALGRYCPTATSACCRTVSSRHAAS